LKCFSLAVSLSLSLSLSEVGVLKPTTMHRDHAAFVLTQAVCPVLDRFDSLPRCEDDGESLFSRVYLHVEKSGLRHIYLGCRTLVRTATELKRAGLSDKMRSVETATGPWDLCCEQGEARAHRCDEVCIVMLST